METRKICRLLIGIFLVLAILFYVLYNVEVDKRETLDDGFVKNAVTNLKSNGIEIKEQVIQKHTPDLDIYTFNLSPSKSHNDIISESIFKHIYNKNSITKTNFDVPVGKSVGVYDSSDTTKELSRIVFYQGDLSFDFSKNGVSISGVDSPLNSGDTSMLSKENKDLATKIVSDFCKKDNLKYRISGVIKDEKTEIVTFIQMLGEYEINGSYVNFVFEDGELVKAAGKWITNEPKKQYHEKLLDGVNVLYKLDLTKVKSIVSERAVFSLKMTENNTYYLLPCWKIEYMDKNGVLNEEFFDAL